MASGQLLTSDDSGFTRTIHVKRFFRSVSSGHVTDPLATVGG